MERAQGELALVEVLVWNLTNAGVHRIVWGCVLKFPLSAAMAAAAYALLSFVL